MSDMEKIYRRLGELEAICARQEEELKTIKKGYTQMHDYLAQLGDRNSALLRRQANIQRSVDDKLQQLSDRHSALLRKKSPFEVARRGASAAIMAKR
ncbi:hypothetical protein ACQZV8_01120 [Magnetococcales bacterium HHB-1]